MDAAGGWRSNRTQPKSFQVCVTVKRSEAPVSLSIANRDWVNWQYTMSVEANPPEDAGGAHRATVTRPRPGHADLSAGLKYERTDLRDILERASARETAARVAVGAIARVILRRIGHRSRQPCDRDWRRQDS
jgi:chorismate synthase